MLKIVDKEAYYCTRITELISRIVQSHNMRLHDFEDIMRCIHVYRLKLNIIRNEKAAHKRKSEDYLL